MGFLSNVLPAIGAAIGGVAGGPQGAMAGASVGGAFSNAQGVSDQNSANQQMSEAQMKFQERMSNNAHVRETEDLKNAGLNRILSVNGGASSPSGSTAQMQNEAPDYSHAISTAMEARMATQNLENLKEQNKLTQIQQEKTSAETETAQNIARDTDLTQRAREGDISLLGNNKSHTNVPSYYRNQNQAEQNEYNARSTEARRAQKDSKFAEEHSTLLNVLDTAQKGANVLSTGASVVKPLSSTGQIKDNRKTHHHVNKTTGEY